MVEMQGLSGSTGGAEGAPRERANGGGRTILVVEDDFDVRFALDEGLLDAGHTVLHASDGAQALRALQAGPLPDLILLDLMMRGMNGREFRRRQLADPALASIPVVIVSAAPALERATEDLGPASILAKPFTLDELLEVIDRCAARR